MTAPALCAALLLAAPPTPLPALVEQVVEAYGGAAALRGVALRVERGHSSSVLHPGRRGALRRVLGRGGDLRTEIRFPGSPPEVRVLAGGRASRNGVEVTGSPPHLAMALQAARLQLPLLLLERVDDLEDLGLQERDGQVLRVVELPLGRGMVLQAGIDPESRRILRSAGAVSGPLELEFATEYGDFRRVKGALVPFREVNWAQGERTGETVLEAVEVRRAPPPGGSPGGAAEPEGTPL